MYFKYKLKYDLPKEVNLSCDLPLLNSMNGTYIKLYQLINGNNLYKHNELDYYFYRTMLINNEQWIFTKNKAEISENKGNIKFIVNSLDNDLETIDEYKELDTYTHQIYYFKNNQWILTNSIIIDF